MVLPSKARNTSNNGQLGIYYDLCASSVGWSPAHVDAQGCLFCLKYKVQVPVSTSVNNVFLL